MRYYASKSIHNFMSYVEQNRKTRKALFEPLFVRCNDCLSNDNLQGRLSPL